MAEPDPQFKTRTIRAAAIAALAGLVSTMLGVGGGVVMVPLFALAGVMRVKRAAGTSLAVISVVIFIGLIAQLVKAPGDIQWPVAGLLVLGAIGGTLLGKWLHKVLPEMLFRYAFCAVLILVSARMLGVLPDTEPFVAAAHDMSSPWHLLYLLTVGVFAGVVAAMFGLGGGVVAVPMLSLAFGFFHDQFTATRATSLAMILPTSLMGAYLHLREGNVDKPLAMKITPAAAVTAVGGVWLAYYVPQDALKVTFAILILLATLRLMHKRKSPMPGESVKNSDATIPEKDYTSPPEERIEGR